MRDNKYREQDKNKEHSKPLETGFEVKCIAEIGLEFRGLVVIVLRRGCGDSAATVFLPPRYLQ